MRENGNRLTQKNNKPGGGPGEAFTEDTKARRGLIGATPRPESIHHCTS